MPFLGATRHGTAPLDHFQVFGERRTGTNFLHHLIEANLPLAGTTKYGWKHGFPTMPCIADTALIAVIVREPFAWLSSLHIHQLQSVIFRLDLHRQFFNANFLHRFFLW